MTVGISIRMTAMMMKLIMVPLMPLMLLLMLLRAENRSECKSDASCVIYVLKAAKTGGETKIEYMQK